MPDTIKFDFRPFRADLFSKTIKQDRRPDKAEIWYACSP